MQVGGGRASFGRVALEAFSTLASFATGKAAAAFTTLRRFAKEAAGAFTTNSLSRFGREAAAEDAFGFGAHRCILVLESPTQSSIGIGRAYVVVGHGHGKNAEEEGESKRDLHCVCVLTVRTMFCEQIYESSRLRLSTNKAQRLRTLHLHSGCQHQYYSCLCSFHSCCAYNMLRTLSKGVNIPACAVSLLLKFNRIVSYRTMVGM